MSMLSQPRGVWPLIPQTRGRTFFVAPAASYTWAGNTYTASDGNDGLSLDRALLTVARAVALATSGGDDVIVLLPGAHSVSAVVAVSKSRLLIMGLPGGRGNWSQQRTSVTGSTAAALFSVTAADVEFAHLHLIPVTAQIGISFSSAAARLYVHDCSFDLATPAPSTSTRGIVAAGGADNVVVEHCYFTGDDAQGPSVVMTATTNSLVEKCLFRWEGATALAACLVVGSLTRGLTIRDNDFLCEATGVMTIGVNASLMTQDGAVICLRNYFSVSVGTPIDNAAAVADVELAGNVLAQVGGATGGTAIVANT